MQGEAGGATSEHARQKLAQRLDILLHLLRGALRQALQGGCRRHDRTRSSCCLWEPRFSVQTDLLTKIRIRASRHFPHLCARGSDMQEQKGEATGNTIRMETIRRSASPDAGTCRLPRARRCRAHDEPIEDRVRPSNPVCFASSAPSALRRVLRAAATAGAARPPAVPAYGCAAYGCSSDCRFSLRCARASLSFPASGIAVRNGASRQHRHARNLLARLLRISRR